MKRGALFGVVKTSATPPGQSLRVLLVDAAGRLVHTLELSTSGLDSTTAAYKGLMAACELAANLQPSAFTLFCSDRQAVKELNRLVPVSEEARELPFMLIRSLMHQVQRMKLLHLDNLPHAHLPRAAYSALAGKRPVAVQAS